MALPVDLTAAESYTKTGMINPDVWGSILTKTVAGYPIRGESGRWPVYRETKPSNGLMAHRMLII